MSNVQLLKSHLLCRKLKIIMLYMIILTTQYLLLPLDSLTQPGDTSILDKRKEEIEKYVSSLLRDTVPLTLIGQIPAFEDTCEYEFLALPLDVEFDEQLEEVLIADLNDNRIKVFSITGEYIRTIGRPGHGPGEFDGPGKIALSSSGRLWVSERSRIQLLDKAGLHITTARKIHAINDISIVNDSLLVASSRNELPNGSVIVLYDFEGNVQNTFGRIDPLIEWFPNRDWRARYSRSFITARKDTIVSVTEWLGTISTYLSNGLLLNYAVIDDPFVSMIRNRNIAFIKDDIDGKIRMGRILFYLVGGICNAHIGGYWVLLTMHPYIIVMRVTTSGNVIDKYVWYNECEYSHGETFDAYEKDGSVIFLVPDLMNAVVYVLEGRLPQ